METPKPPIFLVHRKVNSSPFHWVTFCLIIFTGHTQTFFYFFPLEKDNRRERCESKLVNLHQCLVSDSVAP